MNISQIYESKPKKRSTCLQNIRHVASMTYPFYKLELLKREKFK